MAYPRFQLARNFKFARIESGNITVNSTTYVMVAGSALTIAAQAGDVLDYRVSARLGSEAVVLISDAATIVGGVITNRFGTSDVGGIGSSGWYSPGGALHGISGSASPYVVQSGDLVSGGVTVQMIAKTGTAAARTLYASTTTLFSVWLINLGPSDPN